MTAAVSGSTFLPLFAMNAFIRALCLLPALLAPPAASYAQTVHIQSSGSGSVISIGGAVVTGEGPAQPQPRFVPAFSGIRVDLPDAISYSVGGTPGLTVYVPSNVPPVVASRVDNGIFVVSIQRSAPLTQPIRVQASGPSPGLLVMSGAADVHLAGASGPGLTVHLSGAGNVWVDGHVRKLTAVVSGAGNLHAAQLWASRLELNLSGAGNVDAHADREARVNISGAGNVRVFGNPPRRRVQKSGAGSVDFP